MKGVIVTSISQHFWLKIAMVVVAIVNMSLIFIENTPSNIINKTVNKVGKLQIKKKLSYEAAVDVIKLMNKMPNVSVELTENKQAIKKMLEQ